MNCPGSTVICGAGIPIRTAIPPWLSAPGPPPRTDGSICSLVICSPMASNA